LLADAAARLASAVAGLSCIPWLASAAKSRSPGRVVLVILLGAPVIAEIGSFPRR
jgi:hypothetical protein